MTGKALLNSQQHTDSPLHHMAVLGMIAVNSRFRKKESRAVLHHHTHLLLALRSRCVITAACGTGLQVTYQPDLGAVQEYFLGAGGVFNLYTALTGEDMPGTTSAVAQVSSSSASRPWSERAWPARCAGRAT